LNAATLKGHQLILECFHPSARVFTPYLLVKSLGTGSCDSIQNEPQILSRGKDVHRLGKLRGLYSHFRPLLPDEVHEIRRRRANSWGFDQSNSLAETQKDFVCQNIHLESHELFSQLCTSTKLVEAGQYPGIFLSYVHLSGGVLRVWREWLAERCRAFAKSNSLSSGQDSQAAENNESGRCLLWADPRENVGIRMRVFERDDIPAPTPPAPNEEVSVSYQLQYEGKFASLIKWTLLI
jgi:hypothetical protein